MIASDTLIVVSHYAGRPRQHLQRLTDDLLSLGAHVLIVINDDHALKPSKEKSSSGIPILRRPNIGMNIGAWNAAYQQFQNYGVYVFVQDECQLIRPDFLSVYAAELQRDGVGMTGESINSKWDAAWSAVAGSPLNYRLRNSDGAMVTRVDYYLGCMR